MKYANETILNTTTYLNNSNEREYVVVQSQPIKILNKYIYDSDSWVHPDYRFSSTDLFTALYTHEYVCDIANIVLAGTSNRKYKIFYMDHIDLFHFLRAMADDFKYPVDSSEEAKRQCHEYHRNQAIEHVYQCFEMDTIDKESREYEVGSRMIRELEELDVDKDMFRIYNKSKA